MLLIVKILILLITSTNSRYLLLFCWAYSASPKVRAHANQNNTIAIFLLNPTTSNASMQRSFGTVISGNRRPGGELLDAQQAGILSCIEAGEKKTEIMSKYYCSRRAIYNII